MNTNFIDILVCPLCHGKLIYDRDEQELICLPDHLAYPIRQGIPVMIVDQAREITPEEEAKLR